MWEERVRVQQEREAREYKEEMRKKKEKEVSKKKEMKREMDCLALMISFRIIYIFFLLKRRMKWNVR